MQQLGEAWRSKPSCVCFSRLTHFLSSKAITVVLLRIDPLCRLVTQLSRVTPQWLFCQGSAFIAHCQKPWKSNYCVGKLPGTLCDTWQHCLPKTVGTFGEVVWPMAMIKVIFSFDEIEERGGSAWLCHFELFGNILYVLCNLIILWQSASQLWWTGWGEYITHFSNRKCYITLFSNRKDYITLFSNRKYYITLFSSGKCYITLFSNVKCISFSFSQMHCSSTYYSCPRKDANPMQFFIDGQNVRSGLTAFQQQKKNKKSSCQSLFFSPLPFSLPLLIVTFYGRLSTYTDY